MRLNETNSRTGSPGGFTLIEMIGVLAIIGILAGVLAPKIFDAVARSKINSTAVSYNSVKTSTVDYFAKNSTFPLRSGTGAADTATPTGRFDADLLNGGFVEKFFSCAIGSQLTAGALTTRTHMRSQTAVVAAVPVITATVGGNNFNLDGVAAADFTAAMTVVSVVIPGVSITDAIALNKIIDGVTNVGAAQDVTGRCMYSTPVANIVTIYIYVAHN